MLTLSGVLSGGGGLTLNTAGHVTLTSANTYTGGTTVTAGTLQISADNNLGNASGGLTLSGGARLLSGNVTSAPDRTLGAGGGAISVFGTDNDGTDRADRRARAR